MPLPPGAPPPIAPPPAGPRTDRNWGYRPGFGTFAAGWGGLNAYQRAIEFEREMNRAQARGELSAEDAASFRRSVRDSAAMGMGFTATQSARLGRAYVQAGYEKVADKLIVPTQQFSLYGDIDPFKGADYTTSALSAYGIRPNDPEIVKKAVRYQDIIAKGANLSRLNVEDYAQGFKYAAPYASRLGVTQAQLAAMLSSMGDAGLRGDEIGVAIRSMLTRAVKPTMDSTQVMAELGGKWSDFYTSTKPLDFKDYTSGLANRGIYLGNKAAQVKREAERGVAEGLDPQVAYTNAVNSVMGYTSARDKNKVSGMTARYMSSLGEGFDLEKFMKWAESKNLTTGQISRMFDQRQGARLATLLGSRYWEHFQEIDQNSAGASARGAGIVNQGAVGAHNRLTASYDNLVLSLAESGVLDNIAKVMDSVASGMRSLAETNPKVLEFATYAAMAMAVAGPFAFAIGTIANALGKAKSLLGLGSLAAGVAGVAGASGGAAGVGAAAGGVATVAASRLPLMVRTFGRYLPFVGSAMQGLSLGQTTGEALNSIGSVAGGKYYTPKSLDDAVSMRAEINELNAKIASIQSRTHPSMAGSFNPEIDQLQRQISDLRNRLSTSAYGYTDAQGVMGERGRGVVQPKMDGSSLPSEAGKVEAVVKPDQITAKADVSGSATVTVNIQPTGALAGLLQAAQFKTNIPLVGPGGSGPGSTGRSMPEAAPATGSGNPMGPR